MTGVVKHTILKLLKDIGCACAAYHNSHVRDLRVRWVQADESWSRLRQGQKPSARASKERPGRRLDVEGKRRGYEAGYLLHDWRSWSGDSESIHEDVAV